MNIVDELQTQIREKIKDKVGPDIGEKEWVDFWISHLSPENAIFRGGKMQIDEEKMEKAKSEYFHPNYSQEFIDELSEYDQ